MNIYLYGESICIYVYMYIYIYTHVYVYMYRFATKLARMYFERVCVLRRSFKR